MWLQSALDGVSAFARSVKQKRSLTARGSDFRVPRGTAEEDYGAQTNYKENG